MISVDAFVKTILGFCHTIDCDRFAKYVLKVAMDTKFKEVTIEYVVAVLKQHFGI